jgi:hypothetical protein
MLGRLPVTSDGPDERGRGLELLEKSAKTELARAIRKDDPQVRFNIRTRCSIMRQRNSTSPGR